ncbi:MAG: dephospho-CoA kinase [Chloroflexi bacterium]|nr:dephospho-CoA kinase [Chloroflexota bacterium]MDA1146542.1 dephospho-CoA kinase [Chloroflexota bacterium]MQC82768.1 dephospho-CoA kinase [Chloroflexota bacterium]PKB56745.1 MAG: dephospho-CoA kinase [SAR202 cluster bacterium Casp-Chloro-G1]
MATTIGLTGGIASGKSTVAELLRDLGAEVVEGDRLGHRVYEPGSSGFEKVVNAFGHDIVAADGTIDRRILGGKVFGAPEEMDRLNGVMWPAIREIAVQEFAAIKKKDPDAVIVFEAAVMLEAGWQDLVDEVWVVTTKQDLAIDRLKTRNGYSREQALARIESQMSNRQRQEFADVKFDNSEDEEKLKSRVQYHWKRLLKRIAEPTKS